MFPTIAERALYLAGRLTQRYSNVLNSPEWADEDYEELTGSLLKQVKSLQKKKKMAMLRIDHAKSVAAMTNLTIGEVWGDSVEELEEDPETAYLRSLDTPRCPN